MTGRLDRISVERVVAALLCTTRQKTHHWKQSFDKDTTAFGAGTPMGHTSGADDDESIDEHEACLPIVMDDPNPSIALPSASGEEEEDSDIDADPPRVVSLLQQWKRYDQYPIGMRLAELSVMWHVNGWSKAEFPRFMLWAREHFPCAFGNINHSGRFLADFLPAVVGVSHTCLAGSLHSLIPALGIPSFLARVIDVVSINGRSLLPVIYIYTTSQGNLSWALLGCPCLEYREDEARPSEASTAASGADIGWKEVFGFHKAAQLVYAVHELEKSYNISRNDRALRIITTVADNAIQGPNSTRFSREESLVDSLEHDILSEGVCKFHQADSSGSAVDKLYVETVHYDRLLRLVRRHFAFGTGDLILRGVANKFSQIASIFDERHDRAVALAADAEAANQPLAAQRIRQRASKHKQEAKALHQAGWTQWQRPRAPKADGTRKVVWQAKARTQFFKIYCLVYWGILARMQQSLERARLAASGAATAQTGMQTREMKAWRSLGKAMTNIRVLVFNLGRADFRQQNLSAYALEVQSSLSIGSTHRTFQCVDNMFAASGALVEMRGILKMVQAFGSGLKFVQEEGKVLLTNKDRFTQPLKNKKAMWMTSQTLLAHRCWRTFPLLSSSLTEIVLAGSFRGVSLHGRMFDEPNQPLAASKTVAGRRAFVAAARDERFDLVTQAIDRLIKWTLTERQEFAHRMLQLQVPRARAPVAQGDGLPEVAALDMFDVKNNETQLAETKPVSASGDVENDAPVPTCAFMPRKKMPKTATCDKQTFVDMFVEEFAADEKIIQDAAVDLAKACENMTSNLHTTPAIITETDTNGLEPIAVDENSTDEDTDLDQLDDVIDHKRACESASGESTQVPHNIREFLKLPRHTWVIHRRGGTGKWKVERMLKYTQQQGGRYLQYADPRTRFLASAEQLFGTDLVEANTDVCTLESSVKDMTKYCHGRFWALPKTRDNIFSKVMSKCDPPHEIYEDVLDSEFCEQFVRFRSWMQQQIKQPYGHEFFHVRAFVVKSCETKQLFEVRPSEIIGASLWQPGWIPKQGEILVTRRFGRSVLISVKKTKYDQILFILHVHKFGRNPLSSLVACGIGFPFVRSCVDDV